MTYFNPLFQYGVENFVKDLADTAVKGLIIPDLPHEHANFVEPYLADTDIALIPLVSLTTGLERQKELIEGAEGFVYAVAINGGDREIRQLPCRLGQALGTTASSSRYPSLDRFWRI